MSEQADKKQAKPAQRRKLGKGLGALLGEARREEPLVRINPNIPQDDSELPAASGAPSAPTSASSGGEGLAMLPIADITPHPDQPRRHFDEEKLAELAASIASRGVIQPVIVRPTGRGRYQLVAGERRWRAAQKAQLHEIPVLIRDLEERDVMALALIENIQREDLNPVEEARAYQRLSDDEGLTQAEIARLVEKSRSHVANFQRLLALPDAVLEYLADGRLTMGHARALIGHDDAATLAKDAVKKSLSVRQVEKLARAAGSSTKKAKVPANGSAAKDADIAAVESHLEELLGLSVTITPDADPSSGALTIKYRTLDQLDLICQRLSGNGI